MATSRGTPPPMQSEVLESLCVSIGYAATRTLAVWFAGRHLYVPATAERSHPLWVLLGGRAFSALVRHHGRRCVAIPSESHEGGYLRMRDAAERLAGGASVESLAADYGVSVRRVQMMRRDLVDRGWLDYAAGRRAPPKFLGTGGVFDEPPPPGAGE